MDAQCLYIKYGDMKTIAAKKIQQYWRKANSDPQYLLCQMRLKWEFDHM